MPFSLKNGDFKIYLEKKSRPVIIFSLLLFQYVSCSRLVL